MIYYGTNGVVLIKNEEKILICLSGAPSNARVIRAGAELARAPGAKLLALFVEPSDFRRTAAESQERLYDNIRLAESLGAQVTTLFGEDAATQIAEYARISGATKIVLGKSPAKRNLFARDDIMKRLSELAPDIDIYIIPDKTAAVKKRSFADFSGEHFRPADLGRAALVLLLCTLIGALFAKLDFSTANVILAYTIGVLAIAMLTGGRIVSLVSSVFAVMLFNFFFVAPYYSLRADPSQLATFAVMLVAAFIISSLTTRVKSQAAKSARSAYRTQILLETSQKLQKAEDENAILTLLSSQLGKLLERSITVYPVKDGKVQQPILYSAGGGSPAPLPENYLEDERASHHRKERKPGHFLSRESSSEELVFPVRGTGETPLAMVCIAAKPGRPLSNFVKSLMTAMLDETGIILENLNNILAKREAEEQVRYEELRSSLLNSISHDLRTPLTGISGNAALLMNGSLDEEKKRELSSHIYDDSLWLISLVENLLSMTKISGGKTILKTQPELVSEVFDEALRHIDPNGARHSITSHVSDEFLMAEMDAQLIVQVMINLINNAVKYTPEGSAICISACTDGQEAVLSVTDNGPGIPAETKEKIFDLFYTADNQRGDRRRGIGLGLALCRSIVEAHGSVLTVQDVQPHGSEFSFRLPIVEVNINEQS